MDCRWNGLYTTPDKAEKSWRHTDLVEARHWTIRILPCFKLAPVKPGTKARHMLPIYLEGTFNISYRTSYLPGFAIYTELDRALETTLREVVNTSVRSRRIDK